MTKAAEIETAITWEHKQMLAQGESIKEMREMLAKFEIVLHDLVKGSPWAPISAKDFMVDFQPEIRTVTLSGKAQAALGEPKGMAAKAWAEMPQSERDQLKEFNNCDIFNGKEQ